MKLLFGFRIEFEYLYFKSSREEWLVRVWRKVKYIPPKRKPKNVQVNPTTPVAPIFLDEEQASE